MIKISKRYLVLISLLLTSWLYGNCQNVDTLDSLLNVLGVKNEASEKMDILLAISDIYAEDDPDKAMQYASAALIEADNSNSPAARAEIFQKIGSIYEDKENLDLAIENYQISLELYRTLDIKLEIGHLFYDLADVYKKKGLYKLSLENCLEGLEIFEKLNDIPGLSDIYNCMGSLYKYQGENNRSLDYYNKSLNLNINSVDSHGISMSYNNIGVVYAILGNNDLALDYYFKSIHSSPEKGEDRNNATTLGNIASIMLNLGKYDEAYRYLNESLEMNKILGYRRGIANQYRTLGRYYDLTGDTDLAIKYLTMALDIHTELGRLESEKDIAEQLAILYSREGMYREAYNKSILFKSLSDSIFNLEKMKNIAQLEFDYIHQKADEIQVLKDQKRKIINLLILIVLLLILSIVVFLFYRQKSKVMQKNLEIKNKDLEMKQVKEDLESKQKEVATSTLYLVRKNELINDVVRRLNDSKKKLKEENIPIINDIINDLCSGSEEDIWKEFEVRFLQVNNKFYNNLQDEFPELTKNERRLSAFLSLDFSTKEIAAITKQSPHSINIARTRLRKKLGLANSESDLASFLSKF